MDIIDIQGVTFSHVPGNSLLQSVKALHDVTLRIAQGEFVSILGRNGSGKSTLARLFNALYLPAEGVVRIRGIDTRDSGQLWEIRRLTGMVFPDADSQIVGATVAEDVAFGPENLGIPSSEIVTRVEKALSSVRMSEHAGRSPHLLSGGEKQRLAIAGILAMQPACIILDEATAMLDSAGRQEVFSLLRRLNREMGMTVLHITHQMDEAAMADRLLVLEGGKVVLDGTPCQVFADGERVKELGLDLPPLMELFALLKEDGFDLPTGLLDGDGALAALKAYACKGHDGNQAD